MSTGKRVESVVRRAIDAGQTVPAFVHVAADVYCDLETEYRGALPRGADAPGAPRFVVCLPDAHVPVRRSVRLPRGYIVPVLPLPRGRTS